MHVCMHDLYYINIPLTNDNIHVHTSCHPTLSYTCAFLSHSMMKAKNFYSKDKKIRKHETTGLKTKPCCKHVQREIENPPTFTSPPPSTPSGSEAEAPTSSLSGLDGFVFHGDVASRSGTDVKTCDVNGDGYLDLIIGAQHADVTAQGQLLQQAGRVYIIFGKASGWPRKIAGGLDLTGGIGVSIMGMSEFGWFGLGVACGDVNGDGYGDVIGASRTFGGHGAHVVFGKPVGWADTILLSDLNGNNGFHVDIGDLLAGSVVASLASCDVNGDGISDVIFSSDSTRNSIPVLFGKANGFSATVYGWSIAGSEGRIIMLPNHFPGEQVAEYVVACGDVNGDNIGDIVIGSPLGMGEGARISRGEVHVVFGRPMYSWDSSVFYTVSLDGYNGFRILGRADGSLTGQALCVGDINGDGYGDVVIGSPQARVMMGSEMRTTGEVAVVFGKPSFGASPAIELVRGALGTQDYVLFIGQDAIAQAGASVATGHVNQDGYRDVIIGVAGAHNADQYPVGGVHVVFGRDGTTSRWGGSSDVYLGNLSHSQGFVLHGDTRGGDVGKVLAAGDVNGDGFADIILGDVTYGSAAAPSTGTAAGIVYVVFQPVKVTCVPAMNG
jgi:hypothetical protein